MDVQMKKTLKGKSQTTPFTRRTLRLQLHMENTLWILLPKYRPSQRTHRKIRKGKMTRVENSPIKSFSCASTPYFREFSTKPFTNLQHQPHSRQVMEDSLLLMLVKQRIKYRIERARISGCLLHYWPRPEQPFYSRTPQCDKNEHNIFHKGELRQYGPSTACCPCCYQVSFP